MSFLCPLIKTKNTCCSLYSSSSDSNTWVSRQCMFQDTKWCPFIPNGPLHLWLCQVPNEKANTSTPSPHPPPVHWGPFSPQTLHIHPIFPHKNLRTTALVRGIVVFPRVSHSHKFNTGNTVGPFRFMDYKCSLPFLKINLILSKKKTGFTLVSKWKVVY